MPNPDPSYCRNEPLIVAVAALGQLFNIFPMVLFRSERVETPLVWGVERVHMAEVGLVVLKHQKTGLFCGILRCGSLAERMGRVPVMNYAIPLSSLATMANAIFTSVPTFALARCLAGMGAP